MAKVDIGVNVRINAWAVISRAVEEGAILGWYRAHKHSDAPEPEQAAEAIATAILNELSEVLDFDANVSDTVE